MKLQELYENKRDEIELRRDYSTWKKLVNMPSKTIEWMIDNNYLEQLGITDKEWQRIHGKRSPRIPLNIIDKMRSKPFDQWDSKWINWMYRQIAMVNHFIDREGPYLKDDKTPTDKLNSLWIWGHCPRNYFPEKYGKL